MTPLTIALVLLVVVGAYVLLTGQTSPKAIVGLVLLVTIAVLAVLLVLAVT